MKKTERPAGGPGVARYDELTTDNLASSGSDGKAILAAALEHARRWRLVLPIRSVAEAPPHRRLLSGGEAHEGGAL